MRLAKRLCENSANKNQNEKAYINDIGLALKNSLIFLSTLPMKECICNEGFY